MGSNIQGSIWSVEEGRTGGILRIGIITMLSATLLALFAWFRFVGVNDPVAMEQCSLARNLASGKGFSASCIRPADIALLRAGGRTVDLAHLPEIRQEPAYPVALSGLMRILPPRYESNPRSGVFKPETTRVIPFGIVCTLATAGLIYLLTRMLFSTEAAVIASIAYLLWDPVLSQGISGSSRSLVSLTTTLSLWLAMIASRAYNQQRTLLWLPLIIAAGVSAGITCLGAYALWPMIPGTALLGACLCKHRRGTIFILLLASGIITIAPWICRNIAVSGNPFGAAPWTILNGTSLFPDGSWDGSSAELPTRATIVAAIKAKFLANLPSRIESLFQLLGGTVLAAFFVISFFIRFDNDAANRARWPLLGITLAVLISSSLGNHQTASHLQAFLPLVATFGTAAVLVIAEYRDYLLPETRALIAWSVVALNALPMLLRIWGTPPESPYPPYFPPLNTYAARQIPDATILCTDIPWATAWYANRTSILTPGTPLGFEQLHAAFPSISGLYLAERQKHGGSVEQTNRWICLDGGWVPASFTMTNGVYLPPGTRDQLLLLGEAPRATAP